MLCYHKLVTDLSGLPMSKNESLTGWHTIPKMLLA